MFRGPSLLQKDRISLDVAGFKLGLLSAGVRETGRRPVGAVITASIECANQVSKAGFTVKLSPQDDDFDMMAATDVLLLHCDAGRFQHTNLHTISLYFTLCFTALHDTGLDEKSCRNTDCCRAYRVVRVSAMHIRRHVTCL